MNGVINFNKPKGMTSHDAVYYFRRLLKIKKIGHTGTLDPDATGVLPICIGKGTRVSEYLLNADKEYIGELTLGAETDTQDGSGEVLNTSTLIVNEEAIVNSFSKFKGESSQIPPMYSAVRYKGKKLYELAREGKVVERNPRGIKIYELKILDIKDNKKITFYTKCSRGTYIRTLCNDIGRDLGTYGHMSDLKRVGVGKFKIEDSLSMEYLNNLNIDEINKLIMPIDMALDSLDKIIIDKNYFNQIINGVIVPLESKDINMNKNYRIYCNDRFIGIGKIIIKDDTEFIKMDKVFI
ncbi:MAG: tRNA pseudouridine(55) synthase TruB [Tissierellaceae bacterium]|nr:tRNA pseudouridine(55) synthase TruB [Tissierellaceae bacterium]